MTDDGKLITDFPTTDIPDMPPGLTAYVVDDGLIVFWDGRRQYHTGASEDGLELRRAMKHHFVTLL